MQWICHEKFHLHAGISAELLAELGNMGHNPVFGKRKVDTPANPGPQGAVVANDWCIMVTNRHDTIGTYGKENNQLFPKRWPLWLCNGFICREPFIARIFNENGCIILKNKRKL